MWILVTQTIKDLPISKVEKIEETASAKEAANQMKNKNVSSLVIVDEKGRPVGLVTESDLVKKVCIRDVLPEKVGIAEIMSSPVITITNDKSPSAAAEAMLQKGVRHLLILDNDQSSGFVSLITPLDFLKFQKLIVDEDKEAIEKILDTYESIDYYQRDANEASEYDSTGL